MPQWRCLSRHTARAGRWKAGSLTPPLGSASRRRASATTSTTALGTASAARYTATPSTSDGLETHDRRQLIPGVAVTIEPGIYLPGEFGVRSEIDLFMGDSGPRITTQVQRDVVMIDA